MTLLICFPRALKAGASAYVTKSQISMSSLAALEGVIRGEPFNWNSDGTVSIRERERSKLKSSLSKRKAIRN